MTTFNFFGQKFPVMRPLKDGWYLIATPNGPVIGKVFGSDGAYIATLEDRHEEMPEAVRAEAVAAYREMTWPLVKDTFLK